MPKGIRKLQISVDRHKLTHFGGFFLIHAFCKKLKIKWLLQNQIRFSRLHRSYHPIDLMLSIIYSLIIGIHRLSRTKILQGNGAFQQIVGLKTFPYASSLRRFLKAIDHKTIAGLNKVHDTLRMKMFCLPKPITSLTFDIDSSALTIYGKHIEEAKVGYNPHKKGAKSYHPLLCFEAHTKDYWHGVMRPGDAYTSRGILEFMQACLKKLPPYTYRLRVRADSGFYDHKFIEFLEEKKIGYVIVAKMFKPIKEKMVHIRYHRFRKNWSAGQFYYQPAKWKKKCRFVVIRRPLPEKETSQLSLFSFQRYSYQVFVTNLDLKPENIWYFYRGRAGIEVIIKELKASYALAKIPTRKFLANTAFFYKLLFAYNIINWFKRTCLPVKFQNASLETIHTDLIVLPAKLVKKDNRNILNIPSAYISEKLLKDILLKIENLKLS